MAYFEPIFACSALAVSPSEKSSISTNRKSLSNEPFSSTQGVWRQTASVLSKGPGVLYTTLGGYF